MPGRASSLSSSWVMDKIVGGAGTSTSSVERVGRPMWKDNWKRSASRAPSADRSEKKARAPSAEDGILEPETQEIVGPTFIGSSKEAPLTDDVLEMETEQFAGRTFIVSPDPSELPIPSWFASPDDVLEMETEQFAGPTFIVSPDPSELPIPSWFASPEPSQLPIPSFLKAH